MQDNWPAPSNSTTGIARSQRTFEEVNAIDCTTLIGHDPNLCHTCR